MFRALLFGLDPVDEYVAAVRNRSETKKAGEIAPAGRRKSVLSG
jgi:hypothetical protein